MTTPVLRYRNKGLTLIELMVALAISALLAGATLGIVAQLSGSLKTVQSISQPQRLTRSIQKLLTTDLSNASEYRPMLNGLQLRTMASIDPEDNILRHIPTEVTWEISRDPGQARDTPGRLIRVEMRPGSNVSSRRLVCRDASRIELTAGGQTSARPGGWRPLPTEATLTVRLADLDEPLQWVHRTEEAE